LLMQDQGGALFEIDPSRFKVGKTDRWVSAGNMKPLAGSLDDNPTWPPVVLTADGSTFYMAANPGGGKELVIRKVPPGAGRRLGAGEPEGDGGGGAGGGGGRACGDAQRPARRPAGAGWRLPGDGPERLRRHAGPRAAGRRRAGGGAELAAGAQYGRRRGLR